MPEGGPTMRYTLADLLGSRTVQGWRQLTSFSNFGEIAVSSTTIQEMPAGEAAKPGEVILTTAHECWEQPELFVDMVRGMVQSGAAAVFFSFPNERVVLPGQAVALAQQSGLPLFVIPWEQRLSEIQMEAFRGIREKELLEYHRLQNTLYNLFFQSRPMADAVEAVSRGLRMPAAVLDREGELVQRSWVSDSFPRAGTTPLQVEVGVRPSGLYGVLALYPDRAQREALDPQALAQYVAFPLSLWFHQRSTENMANTRVRNEFVWNLANSRDIPLEEQSRQGAYLGFDLSLSYTCMAMRAQLPGEGENYSPQMAQSAFEVLSLLLREAGRQGLRIMAGSLGLSYILYLENRPEGAAQGVNAFLDGADGQLRRRFPQWAFFWGVGETEPGPTDFPGGYEHAALALKYCLNAQDSTRRFTYQNTQKALIVSTLSQNQEVRERAQRALRRLMDYDAGSEIRLMDTLIAYICANYNISQTARSLHIHRQSLSYRLEKIEQLTGMSLGSHEDLFLLEVYSRIYRSY